METWQLVYIIIVHFLFDWVLQPRWMALKKTKNTTTALIHGFLVALPLFVIFSPLITLLYAVIHGLQDRTLYNLLNRAWNTGDKDRDMVNHVAVDQVLHFLTIILLYNI